MNAVDPNLRPAIATRLLAGISVPDTPVISRAIEYAREHSEPYLFNHVMRSWLFAVILAQLSESAHDVVVSLCRRAHEAAETRWSLCVRDA
jgi:hypothetical protein